ncbi:MAG: hypothetical protein KDJ37_09580 [Hyphomicrobiaceae bacterium]|nr:hypothetical protein [Hyphomicrobiaceae bacterium]
MIACVATVASAEPPAAPVTGRIHTAGAGGAYHTSFCPPLAAALDKAGSPHLCTPSLGTEANMGLVLEAPADLAFGQFDIFALDREVYGGDEAFTTIRIDDARECIYAVTRNAALETYGDLSANAGRLRIILPPAGSGSAGTFRFLQAIDADLAQAREVRHVETTEEAIRMALSADDMVAVFVQFPDPSNTRFKMVGDLGGHFVPLVGRSILSRKIGGQHIYLAQEIDVADARWLKRGTSIITACTPLVLFTGNSDRISDPEAREKHRLLVDTIRALPADTFRPKDSLVDLVLRTTRALSATAVENLISISEKAREKTGPLIEKAQEATTKALEGAKPHIEKAKESGSATLERAKESVKELIEPAKPVEPGGDQPPPPGKN